MNLIVFGFYFVVKTKPFYLELLLDKIISIVFMYL